MKNENKVTCPHCDAYVKPDVDKNDTMIFAIECPICGYDMKREILENYYGNEG